MFVGGFAFAPDGGATPEWSSFAPARLVLPEVALARHRDEARLTVCARVDGDEHPDAVLDRVRERLAELQPASMPLIDPDPVERVRVASAAPPSHFEEAVRRATERIGGGGLEKVVLAREVRVHAPGPLDPAPVFGALREVFPACYCYLAGTPEGAFVGASPELLVRREGARAQTVALAGTTRRSADPAVDDLLGEQLLAQRQGPRRARHRGAAHRAHARPGEPLDRGGRRPGSREGAQRAAPGHADPRAAARAAGRGRAGGPAAPDARGRGASRARPRCR